MDAPPPLHSARFIRELLSRHGLGANKWLGQHFLCDATLPRTIVECAGVSAGHGVLEIGPGLGALTRELSCAAARVIAVEKDIRLVPVLEEVLRGLDNVTLVQGDILSNDVSALVRIHMKKLTPVVCANLPYNITTPILTCLLDLDVFDSITVMVQREVAQRLCASAGTRDYGAFTLYVGVRADVEILLDVPPNCFFPPPKVMSSVVKLTRRIHPLRHPKLFNKIVRAAFIQRRKTLPNALSSVLGFSKAEVAQALEASGVSPMARGETLDIAAFDMLTNLLCHCQTIN